MEEEKSICSDTSLEANSLLKDLLSVPSSTDLSAPLWL